MAIQETEASDRRDDMVLRELSRPQHKTERRRIESIVSRLEDLLKQERNKEGRLAGMVGRSFGGANTEKNESHPEPVAAGIVGQLESLLDKLARTNEMQAVAISKLEELL
jgi:hypothetical protein